MVMPTVSWPHPFLYESLSSVYRPITCPLHSLRSLQRNVLYSTEWQRVSLIAVGLLSAQIIITLRTCGMWARRRWVMVTLGVLTLISLLFGICITFYQIKFVNVEMTPLGYSLILSRVPTLCAFIFSFLSESVIVILTIIRAYQYFQQSRSPWVVQIYKSGIIYCIFIICTRSVTSSPVRITP